MLCSVLLSALCATPQAYDRQDWKATLTTLAHDTAATVTIVDADTMRVDNFHYDGGGDGFVYFKLAVDDNYLSFFQGTIVSENLYGQVFNGGSLTLNLPAGQTLDGYGAISLWCEPASANFGSASFEYPRAGWTAELSTLAHGVSGTVTIVDEDTLQVDEFNFDGQGVVVVFYLAEENSYQSFLNGIGIGNDLVGPPFVNASFQVDLPAGETMDGWNAISVWCVPFNANFGSGAFDADFTLDVSGSCPGSVRMDVRGATPDRDVALIYASDLGNVVVPTGNCAGTMLGLGMTQVQLVNQQAANSAGDLILMELAPAAACGGYLQALDTATCKVSEVITVP